MTVYEDILGLVNKSIEAKLMTPRDSIYAQNQVMHLLDLEAFPEEITKQTEDSIPNLLEKLISYAIDTHVIEDVLDDKEILTAKLMDSFMPRPSDVERVFYEKYDEAPTEATDYFYELSKNSNYIQMNRIRKNIDFTADTPYGKLDITINLSKPEKDPEQIRRERKLKPKNATYPPCVLCAENEGYVGRTAYPARANHRIISVPLYDETWYLQYSPYVYYHEHSILLSEEHRDMKIDDLTFYRLLKFVEKYPHYFLGSNADLPIVGGSILSHDHYQGGRYNFAIEQAEELFHFQVDDYPNVEASVLKWPLSVIRLHSTDLDALAQAADDILKKWIDYSDAQSQIIAYTNAERHNTITPIARKRDDQFELDLVLRNNRTSTEHPMGIFHPHADVHHIKKENIGLIEVIGLAVLPARLKDELEEIKQGLLGKDCSIADYHIPWFNDMKARYGKVTDDEEASKILEHELGIKFARVLEHAGVFKQTEAGKQAFKKFTDQI